MRKVENYRPAVLDFTTESNEVPKYLGEEKFETPEEAHKFMNEHFVASSTKFTATRFMDDYEIGELRHEYQEELEEILPELKELETKAKAEFEKAKEEYSKAKEQVSASLQKIQSLSDEVREGTTEVNLDQAFTYELVYKGKRFYFTIVDKRIQLCGVREIPLYEQDDLISSSERNAQSFESMQEVVNG
ncbi:hypothetical protein [Mesonia sp. K4-1]|uniref:hypothetical protein n=1 Tax=Mesonia sp. K4-1 TaxID=2602760 RepID=UPI0011C8CABB|nr:hypothetical protein [Mesonia sp. K4-1]TXK78713.1 hypothetical protein FT986_02655 [Mesonia sp. K4-1]